MLLLGHFQQKGRGIITLGNRVGFWQVEKMKSNMWRCRGLLLGGRPSSMTGDQNHNLRLISSTKAHYRLARGKCGLGPGRSTESEREYWHKNKWEQANCRVGNEVSPQSQEVLEQPSRRRSEFKNTTAFRAGLSSLWKRFQAMAAPSSRRKAGVKFGKAVNLCCYCRTCQQPLQWYHLSFSKSQLCPIAMGIHSPKGKPLLSVCVSIVKVPLCGCLSSLIPSSRVVYKISKILAKKKMVSNNCQKVLQNH